MKKSTLEKSKLVKPKPKIKRFFQKQNKTSSSHKIKKKPVDFPNIFRIITEKHFFSLFILLALTVAIVFSGFNLYKNINQKQEIDQERQEIIREVEFWKSVVSEYSDYRDAYFQLALLEYRLNNFKEAKFYLEKTLDIDPNFEKGRELEEILNSKSQNSKS